MNDLVFKPSLNPLEFVKPKVLKGLFECNLFTPMTTYVDNFFKDPRLKQLIEFPVLFLGATAAKTPSLYSLMNYADIYLGTWYPMGGMHEVIKAMCQLAEDHGVKMNLGAPVSKIVTNNKQVSGLEVNNTEFYESDYVVASADYHHVETKLLNSSDRSYTDTYWDTRVMAPSSLIFYVGVQGKLENLEHHNLFFDESLDEHSHEIYEEPCWPTKPLFYVSCTSKTDSTVAPKGCENLFILIPVAPNLQDTEEIRQKYYELIMDRLEKHTKQEIRSKVIFKKSFAHQDFMDDYHAFKGNAYGLANTLMQTALLKPSLKSRKVKNLYFAGQLTVPGPGVPPSLISGQVVSSEILKKIKQNQQQLAGSTN
jgi:phytoene desaturase